MASFAINGLLLGFFSLSQVHQVLAARLRPAFAWLSIAIFTVGSSYGIYLGRVQRWNSWDILRHPMRIAMDCLRPGEIKGLLKRRDKIVAHFEHEGESCLYSCPRRP